MTNNFEDHTPMPGYPETEPPALRELPLQEREPAPEFRASASGGLPNALSAVARGYAAAHGHPLEHDGLVGAQKVRRRWELGLRAALILIILLCLFGVFLAVKTIGINNAVPMSALTGQGNEVIAPGTPDVVDTNGSNSGAAPITAEHPDTDGSDSVGSAPVGADSADSGPSQGPVVAPDVGAPDVVVHVAGQVYVPGVVRLSSGARVADAVAAAGGLTPEANPSAINLAQVLVDSEQIYVPAVGEEILAPLAGPPDPSTGEAVAPEVDTQVNINTADSVLLQTLPGIGPALAERILTWRTTNGRFMSNEDLLSVSGIGPAVMGKIQALITVG